jgi:hypothetical protein
LCHTMRIGFRGAKIVQLKYRARMGRLTGEIVRPVTFRTL